MVQDELDDARKIAEKDLSETLLADIEQKRANVETAKAFLEDLLKAERPGALRMVIASLRPRFEPKLVAQRWENVVPALEAIDTLDEIRAAVEDPQDFLRRIAGASIGA